MTVNAMAHPLVHGARCQLRHTQARSRVLFPSYTRQYAKVKCRLRTTLIVDSSLPLHYPRVQVRWTSLEAGEGKTGHIHTDTDEGLFFFGSRFALAMYEISFPNL